MMSRPIDGHEIMNMAGKRRTEYDATAPRVGLAPDVAALSIGGQAPMERCPCECGCTNRTASGNRCTICGPGPCRRPTEPIGDAIRTIDERDAAADLDAAIDGLTEAWATDATTPDVSR